MKHAVSALLLALALATSGCRRDEVAPKARVEFGVFFGGQVQELAAIPLPRGTSRSTHGIRIEFQAPPERAHVVKWEVTKPRPSTAGDAGMLVEYGEVSSRPGEVRLDIPLPFRSGDRTGDWHVRATIDGEVVLERDFQVVAAPTARPNEDED